MELLCRVASSIVALVYNVRSTAILHYHKDSETTGRFGVFSDTALQNPQEPAPQGHFS